MKFYVHTHSGSIVFRCNAAASKDGSIILTYVGTFCEATKRFELVILCAARGRVAIKGIKDFNALELIAQADFEEQYIYLPKGAKTHIGIKQSEPAPRG
jgi:hypothetical protein